MISVINNGAANHNAEVVENKSFHCSNSATKSQCIEGMDVFSTPEEIKTQHFSSCKKNMNLKKGKCAENCKKPVLHVEIVQRKSSISNQEFLRREAGLFLNRSTSFHTHTDFYPRDVPISFGEQIVQLKICELDSSSERKYIDINDVVISYHIYRLDSSGPVTEDMTGADGEETPAATQWMLPSTDFHSVWENLIYDTDIKEQLLNFVSTTLLFSDRGVDSNVISWNRVLLLHGPPGTGKTSLCKALAQKLSIRLGDRYRYGQLFEVNSHSLFSKWFSESGKLVQKLFNKITELVEDPQALVCILIDEVESLTRARAATANGSDPSDALRVVNALLTQLDQIKRYPNVLILTTSNITGTIDLAFVDRADIKQYVGLPSPSAIYQIYYSCIMELIKAEIITPRETILPLREFQITQMAENHVTKLSVLLWKVAEQSEGLSGRSLRKIPFLAHAIHIQKSSTSTLSDFLLGMEAAVEKHKSDTAKITSS